MKLKCGITNHIFTEYLKNKNYSDSTITAYTNYIKYFFTWLKLKNKTDIREVTKKDIFEYRRYLKKVNVYDKRCKDNHLSTASQICKMNALKALFRFLMKNEYLLVNPFDSIDLKIKKRYKGRLSIDVEIMNKFLDSINQNDRLSIRNRVIFELMYGTGLRVSEIVHLNITDIDLNNGKALIREGKGKKDRFIPLGSNVVKWLRLYLKRSRNKFICNVKDKSVRDSLFFSIEGKRLSCQMIRKTLKKYFKELDLDEEKVSPHVLRHSFATHMLENGAGIKYVKDILGHKSIQTTVVYTHFSVKSLKRIMKMYHPRENQLYEEFNKRLIKHIF